VGKHANLIDWEQGSWLFICELLVDLALDPDGPRPPARHAWSVTELARAPGQPPLAMMESCGSCTACIDACPTGAIVADKTVDARRCISYLTIELRGPIPPQWRRGMGDWVFGCDVCQAVCPWNREAPVSNDADLSGDPARAAPDLVALLQLDAAGFRERFRHTALARPRRRGLLRNAATALGNLLAGHVPGRASLSGKARDRALAALTASLADAEPLVRGAAAWALGEAGERSAAQALARAAAREADPLARQELDAARQRLG
jgi:epoxyqueuosine reductase